ncbi:MAG: bis(5'-nucleosyl)-tetraphosphatase (symmetrical) YqeK [Mycoplasmataceae bacterium]|nr:bis(5'-nucleosyl)-tetraphosphatase (symmetrical) YqeK [Mycoplasmataceae bacterium]
MDIEEIAKKRVKNLVSAKRYNHSLRVADLAKAIAIANKINPEKAWLAGMYHDIAKEFEEWKILQLVGDNNTDHFPNIKTMHGLAGAAYIRNNFKINDSNILRSIKDHVIPPKNISKMGKIVFIADKLEPGRLVPFTNRTNLIALAKVDLDLAFKRVIGEIQSSFED